MKSVSSALASEFKVIYQPLETKVQFDEVLLKLKEEQLATSLVIHHLKSVAPSLADEFHSKCGPSVENIPSRLYGLLAGNITQHLLKENIFPNGLPITLTSKSGSTTTKGRKGRTLSQLRR